MTDRRKFLKTLTLTATAGAMSLPIIAVAQEDSKFVPPIISFLLDDGPLLVTSGAASDSVIVSSPFGIDSAASTSSVSLTQNQQPL